ncbi:hypothetical protein JW906_16290 [bacterium]|nr:hypothetical protein [bacterium]
MAFIRENIKRGLSLPSLIDIIFLLLIFSLVTLNVSDVSDAVVQSNPEGSSAPDLKLPTIRGAETEKFDQRVRTLLFQIEHRNPRDPASAKVLYVLDPGDLENMDIRQAKQAAVEDSAFAVFPPGYLTMPESDFSRIPACRLIRESIQAYKDRMFPGPRHSNSVEIRAVEDTEFRIIRFIMDRCSAYGDTIPRIIVHTLTGREAARGI